MELEEGLASNTQEDDDQPSSLKIPPFTPTHHLRDRFLSFTEFLLGNVEEWSSPQPPWPPPPPPIAFSGSDRFIKGRLPHRTMAIAASLSSLIGDATPCSDACKHGDVHADHDDTLAKMQDVRLDDTLSKMLDAANTHCNSSINDHSSDNALNFDAHCMHGQADDSLRAVSSSELVDVSACSSDNTLKVDTNCMPPQDNQSIWGLSENEAIDVAACGTGSSLEVDTERGRLQDGSVQVLSSNEAVDVATCGTDNCTNRVYGHDDLPLHVTVIVERPSSTQPEKPLSTQPDGLDGNVSVTEVLDGSVDDALVVEKNHGCRQYEGGCLPFSDVSLETVEVGNVATETSEDAESGHGHSLPLECKSSLVTSFTNAADGLPEPSPTKIHTDNLLRGTDMKEPFNLGFDAQLDDLEEGELSERLPDDEYLDTLEEGKATGEAELQERDPLDATRLESKALESTTDDEMDQPISLFVSRYRTRSNNSRAKEKRGPRKKSKAEDEEQVLQELVSAADAGVCSQSGQVKGILSKVARKRAKGAQKGGQQLNIGSGNANKDTEFLVVESGLSQISIGSKAVTSEQSEDLEKKYVGLGAAQISGHQVMSIHSINESTEGASCTPGKGLAQHILAGSEQVFVPKKHKGFSSMVVEEDLCLSTIDAGNDQKLASQKTEVAFEKPKRTLTVQRKKKRQQAKHRKRDKRLEALGIRKLKLKPFVEKKKEKVIKICNFYAKGRCSKGTSCTFSHDIIPTTKSEMCKYFINNCCLKGDDCPYSHALSSFPCKYFHTRGYCLDADSCRFSHEPISEEAKQELHRKIEQEQQVRQGIVNDGSGHVDSEHSMPVCNSKAFPLRGIPVDKTAERPKGKDAVANSSSLTRVKKGFSSELSSTSAVDVSNNRMLSAAKKAASTLTVAPTNATNLDVNRSLFCGGSLDTRGPSPCKSKDKSTIFTSPSTERESGQLLGPGSALATGNSILTQDRKTKIDAFLQAQLDDSRLMRKSKLAMGPETIGGCYSLSDQRRALPIGQTLLSNMPSMSLSSGWEAKAKGSSQVSLDHSQLIANLKPTNCTDYSPNSGFLIGQESVSKRRLSGMGAAASGPSVSAPTLLDLILKPQEAAVPEWPASTSGSISTKTDATPKRSRADTILDRIL